MYHIVFGPYNRAMVLHKNRRDDLYRYCTGLLKNRKCHVYRIGGIEDHMHILTSVHPTEALSELIHDLKLASSKWIKENRVFQGFDTWQEGYGAFTQSMKEKDRLIEYIKNQEKHQHPEWTFLEEYKELLKDAGIEFDEKYLP
jgi:putative transposase